MVMSRYLYLYYRSKCDMGEVARLVYEELQLTITAKPDTLKRNHFLFSIDKIHKATQTAHEKLNGLSGGCNPAQRSFPLAFCPWIEDEDLFQIARDEAALTHFSPISGQISGLLNLICRRLLKHDEWTVAVNTAFTIAPNLAGEIREIKNRYEHDDVLRPNGHLGYAPNTLHTALYIVTRSVSFEDAVRRAKQKETDYCPALVGILAAARWPVPQLMIVNSQKDTLEEIRIVAKCFSDEWDVINGNKRVF